MWTHVTGFCRSAPGTAVKWLKFYDFSQYNNRANQITLGRERTWELKSIGETRTYISRKVREIESGSSQRWLGWRGDGWSFLRGQPLWMIICKRLVPPDDQLQEAGPYKWLFARGRSLLMIICKRLAPPDDHLQEASSSGWSFVRGRPLRMVDNNNNKQ